MKFGPLVSLIGGVGMMSLLSMHTAHAATVLSTTVAIVETFNGPVVSSAGLPEPATWTMLIMGFGAIGATLRRGRAQRAKAVAAG